MNIQPSGDEYDHPPEEHPDTRIATMGQRPLAVINTPQTPAQARVDSVSRTMDAAMNRASTLTLTPEEVAALKADFPDEAFKPGAAGKENLLYLEHPFLRDRLDTVVGMGQWAILRTRPHWAEEFTTQKGEKATRIYADCALLVRGCMVAESIGDMVYYPNNASQNYGDAAEGAVTAAFRRCAKNFGVGLQAWKKDWCEGWWQRKRGQATRPSAPSRAPEARGGIGFAKAANDAPEVASALKGPLAPFAAAGEFSEPTTDGASAAFEAASVPKLTPKQRLEGFEKRLAASKSQFISQAKHVLPAALEYFRGLQHGAILANEGLEDMPPASMFPSARVDATPEENHTAVRADRDRHMAGIKAIMDANDQLPGAEMPTEAEDADFEPPYKQEPQARKPMPAGTESRRIRLKGTSAKPGTKKNGQPYTKYGVVDSEGNWLNHFSDSLNAACESLKGQDVVVWFKTSEYGADLIDIHALDETL